MLMRRIFTSFMTLLAAISLQAQDIDTSGWNAGDDVTDQLNWGDYDGSFSG